MTNHTNNHHDNAKEKQGLFNQWAKPQASKTDTPAGCGTYIGWGIMAIFGLFIFTLGAAAVFPPLAMYLLDNPDRFKLKLPYNAIDFQKIAYIDNQFVMYGIDYNSDRRENNLVIFNSLTGESWTKSTIFASESEVAGLMTNTGSTFTYFNHQCMLIGAYSRILVSNNCQNWHYQIAQLDNQDSNFLYSASGAVVVNNTLYVSSGKDNLHNGVFSTHDGIHWQKESLPRPESVDSRDLRGGFSSIAAGNNKIIALGMWWQQDKRLGVIYTKNLTTNKWSYEVYPEYIANLTRGKDRFVAMTESSALVLVDGRQDWTLNSNVPWGGNTRINTPSEVSIDPQGDFVSVNLINISQDGLHWSKIKLESSMLYGTAKLACSLYKCISVDDNYQIIISDNGTYWKSMNFNHKNPKPHWWKSYF